MNFPISDNFSLRRKMSPQLLKAMKLTAVFLLAFFLQLSAKSVSQVTLSLKNVSAEKVFREIERQTGIGFLYTKRMISDLPRVTIEVKNAPVSDVLDKCFNGQPLEYSFDKNTIVITRRKMAIPATATASSPVVIPLPPPIEIKGRVIDENGNPLAGVSVSLKGNPRVGTTTDGSGNYSLTVDDGNGALVFSSVGFEEQEVSLNGRLLVNVTLSSTAVGLNQVVVTALGIKREARALGYSTSSVSQEELTENRTPKFTDALAGRVPGVNITSVGSGPGGTSKIRIRGQSSLGGENSPLIVINGVPVDNTNFGAKGGENVRGSLLTVDGGDGLSSINPDDIESMTILKGAAASALYGARAKDGVIMITTKRGEVGSGLSLRYSNNLIIGVPLDFTDYQYEYGQGENGVRPNAPNPTSGSWSFGEKFEPGMTQILFDNVEVPYTPQKHHIRDFYRNAKTINNTISTEYGGSLGSFNLSLSDFNSESIYPGSHFDKKNVNVGFSINLAKKLQVFGNINYSNEITKNPPNVAQQDFSPVIIYAMANSMPLPLLKEFAFTKDGDEYPYSRWTNRTNPYFALTRFMNIERDRIYGNISAKYDFTSWLYLQGRIGQDFYSRDEDYNLPNGTRRVAPAPPGFINGEYVQDGRRFREINTDFLLGVNRGLGNFDFDLQMGGNQMRRMSQRHNVLVEDFYSRGLYTVENGRQVSPLYDIKKSQVNSLYGTLSLSYKNFLYLTGTGRNDWFSTLSPSERSIFYPSISSSIIFSQLFKTKPSWLTFGQLRISYAEVGSDTDVPPYSNALNYSIDPQQFAGANGVIGPLGGILATTVPNLGLRPMREKEQEIGLRMQLLDSRIGFDISYYNKKSVDQIVRAQISNSSGFTTQLINAGSSRNRGVEFSLNGTPLKERNITWDISINASYNKTRVLDLGEALGGTNSITVGTGEFAGELRQEVGKEMDQLYGYGYLRASDGRIIFDENTGLYFKSNDQINFGSALPKWIGGINNNIRFKEFSFSFLIDFNLGGKMISGTHINAYREGLSKSTLPGRAEGFVIGDGVNPDGGINKTQAKVQTYYETIRTLTLSEQSVFNSGFWELRQVNLSYDFTKLISSSTLNFIKGLSLSISAHNVAVLKKWVPHIHPEQSPYATDNMQGLESTGLPMTTDLGFRLNVRF